MKLLRFLLIRWLYSRVPFPAPAWLLPRIHDWAIGAKIRERLSWDREARP